MRALLLALAVTVAACAPPPALSGTELDGAQAPDFTLVDGVTGETVRLSSLRGTVVALAFLYTTCPDICPLTAAEFARAREELGGDAERVTFVAVSTDPDGDTPERVRRFSEAHGLDEGWHYLVGPRASLEAVWRAYGIGVIPDPPGVGHTDAVYLIDEEGRERALVRSPDLGEHLVEDLRILLRD